MSFPAVYLGNFSAARTAQLALVAQDAASGENVRAIRLVAGETLPPDERNYWTMQVGMLSESGLSVVAQVALTEGLVEGRQKTLSFPSPLLVSRGATLACRFAPSGSPPPISGLSAVVEWGILSTNRSAR